MGWPSPTWGTVSTTYARHDAEYQGDLMAFSARFAPLDISQKDEKRWTCWQISFST